MGKIDDLSKKYMRDNSRFADLVNNAVFDGNKVIDPGRLVEKDPTELGIIPQQDRKSFLTRQKVRDVLKGYEDDSHELLILLIGVENQAAIHYAMPVRNDLYDTLDYADQIEKIKKQHKSTGSFDNSNEFLSGITKNDKLIPVITLILYLGDEPWDGPRSLHEMLNTKDERILRFVPDYRINLIDPHEIDDFSHFSTNLRWLMEAVKAGRDKKSLTNLFENNKVYQNLDTETAELITAALGMPDYSIQQNKQGGVNMCNAVTQIMDEGRAEGRTEGGNIMVYSMVEEGDISPEKGAKRLNITVEKLKERMIKNGYKWPKNDAE